MVAITEAQVEAENKAKTTAKKSTATKSTKTNKTPNTEVKEELKDNAMNAYNEVDSLKKSLSKLKNTVDKVKANTSSPLTVTRKARVKVQTKASARENQNEEIDKKLKNIVANKNGVDTENK